MLHENISNDILQNAQNALQNKEHCYLDIRSFDNPMLNSITQAIKKTGIFSSSILVNAPDKDINIDSYVITDFINTIINHIKNTAKDNSVKLIMRFDRSLGLGLPGYICPMLYQIRKKLTTESLITFGEADKIHEIKISIDRNNNKLISDDLGFYIQPAPEESTLILIENVNYFLGYYNIGLTLINTGINFGHLYISPTEEKTEENKVTSFVDVTKILGIGLTAYKYTIGTYLPWIGAGVKITYGFYKKDHYEIKDIIQEIITSAALMTIAPQLTNTIVLPDTSMQAKIGLIFLEGLITLFFSNTVYQNGNNLYKEIVKNSPMFDFSDNEPLPGNELPQHTEL